MPRFSLRNEESDPPSDLSGVSVAMRLEISRKTYDPVSKEAAGKKSNEDCVLLQPGPSCVSCQNQETRGKNHTHQFSGSRGSSLG